MNKYNIITIRVFLFITVGIALYFYYPFAYRTFASLTNNDWHDSAGTFAAGGSFRSNYEILVNIFLLGSFIIGFIALPGMFLFNAWRLNKKMTAPHPARRTKQARRGIKNCTIAGVDEKLLLNAYNQLQHIEVAMDTRLAKIKEDLVTELYEKMQSMFVRKTEAEQWLHKTQVLYKSGNYGAALRSCNSAIELSPTGLAYYIRGALRHREGQDEAAVDDLKTAAKLGYQKAQDFLIAKGVAY